MKSVTGCRAEERVHIQSRSCWSILDRTYLDRLIQEYSSRDLRVCEPLIFNWAYSGTSRGSSCKEIKRLELNASQGS